MLESLLIKWIGRTQKCVKERVGSGGVGVAKWMYEPSELEMFAS